MGEAGRYGAGSASRGGRDVRGGGWRAEEGPDGRCGNQGGRSRRGPETEEKRAAEIGREPIPGALGHSVALSSLEPRRFVGSSAKSQGRGSAVRRLIHRGPARAGRV